MSGRRNRKVTRHGREAQEGRGNRRPASAPVAGAIVGRFRRRNRVDVRRTDVQRLPARRIARGKTLVRGFIDVVERRRTGFGLLRIRHGPWRAATAWASTRNSVSRATHRICRSRRPLSSRPAAFDVAGSTTHRTDHAAWWHRRCNVDPKGRSTHRVKEES